MQTNNANENYSILVVGLGPAGIALSYYLLNLGYTVVAIDGTKIEDIKNIDQYIKKPIYDIYKIADNINNENKDIPYGFGGVSEYGITNRWDKRLLHIIRIMMERKNFI